MSDDIEPTEYADLNMADDFDRAIWQIREEYSNAAEIESELRLARLWAERVEVDYDEGPSAIGFHKDGSTYWYLIGDACWDADDPRSELLGWVCESRAWVTAERDLLAANVAALTEDVAKQRALVETLTEERDEARTYRADYLAAWLHLTNAAVPVLIDGKPATLADRVRLLAASRDEMAKRFVAAEKERDEATCTIMNLRSGQALARQANEAADAEIGRLRALCLDTCGLAEDAAFMRDDADGFYQRAAEIRDRALAGGSLDAANGTAPPIGFSASLGLRVKVHENGPATPNIRVAFNSAVDRRDEDSALAQLARLQPLRHVLRSWDWAALLEDERIPDEAVLPLLRAFATVEREENEAAKAKEGGRG